MYLEAEMGTRNGIRGCKESLRRGKTDSITKCQRPHLCYMDNLANVDLSHLYWNGNSGDSVSFRGGWACVAEIGVLQDTPSKPCAFRTSGGQHQAYSPRSTRWPSCDGCQVLPEAFLEVFYKWSVPGTRSLSDDQGEEYLHKWCRWSYRWILSSCLSREGILWRMLYGCVEGPCRELEGDDELSAAPVTCCAHLISHS